MSSHIYSCCSVPLSRSGRAVAYRLISPCGEYSVISVIAAAKFWSSVALELPWSRQLRLLVLHVLRGDRLRNAERSQTRSVIDSVR